MPCKVTSGRTAQSFSVQSAVEGSSRSRMKASIIIATFNRGESLTLVLNGLASMVVPSDVEWEVLLVDNKSTDSTKAVILRFAEEHRENFRYLFEGKQGKSHALNSAILQAQGDVLMTTHYLTSKTARFVRTGPDEGDEGH